MNVIIDGRFVLDESDLHRRMAGAFGYGPLYCPSLDALHDRLAAGDPRPVQLTWAHGPALRLALGPSRYAGFVAMLETVEEEDAGKDWAQRFVFRLLD